MRDGDGWIEVTIVTSHQAVDAASGVFYRFGVSGVAIEDPKDMIERNADPRQWDYVEDRYLPEDTGEARVKGYFLSGPRDGDIVKSIKHEVDRFPEYGLDKGPGEVSVRIVYQRDWANEWKKYYKPFRVGEHLVIKPTWEDYQPREDDIVIELDPGSAFGTGSHETTRMCMEMLQKYVRRGCTVFDVGCGSGILSIVSSKLGAGHVTGIDIDEAAADAAVKNVRISGERNVRIKRGRLLEGIGGKADIVVANIIADVVIDLADAVDSFLSGEGIFICSGIISEREDDVKEALSKNGLRILEVKTGGDWVAIASSKR